MNERPKIFDSPAARLCLDTMAAWMNGEPVWPYQKIIDIWGMGFMDWRKQWRLDYEALVRGEKPKSKLSNDLSLFEARDEYIGRWGFAIPCKELIDALREAAPIVEIGAGSGYMTKLMRNAGIDVVGSDFAEHQSYAHGFVVGKYDVRQMSGFQAKTIVRRFPDRTVFCSWPTLKHTWFRQALRAMATGQKLIVIREECCAEDSAWQYIDEHFEECGIIDLPVFPGLHDHAAIYVKRRHHVQGNRVAMFRRRRASSRRPASANAKRASQAARRRPPARSRS